MEIRHLLIVSLLAFGLARPSSAEPTLEVTLKVGVEAQQKLLGFGCSLVDPGTTNISLR